MKANKLTDTEMREIGFTDYNKKDWYMCRVIEIWKTRSETFDVTFNITINKKTLNYQIEILDEAFLQPCDPTKEGIDKIKQIINDLKQKGVLSGEVKY